MFAERGHVTPLADGTALVQVAETQDFLTFFKVTGPGKIQRLGATQRSTRATSESSDLQRSLILERDYRADAWMSKVVRQ